jgi:sarcosine oxidase subunit beta
LLNCAGAWAGALAAKFGEPVPMQSGHPAMAVTEPVPHFMGWSLGVEGGGVYGRQVARGNLVLGGGSGFALDTDRSRSARDAILSLTEQAVALLPVLRHVHIIRTWSGTEGYLPDRQPVIGPSGTTPGLFHGFGFAGGGFQVGPAAGEVLAELAALGATGTPIDAFSIRRFAGELVLASTAPVESSPPQPVLATKSAVVN